ncbi:MAG: SPFH domain-containing protein [Sediminibacterium sp.]|nr:SPFH domain-containing protein [Sediminibacterium sp.]
MFGISYIKFDSMTHVIHFKNGRVNKEGRGLSFFYFAPNSSIAAIPMGSNDLPFIFHEVTGDYQQVSIQGHLTYRVTDPSQLAALLDFTINANGLYKKNEQEKLHQRLINAAQTATSAYIHQSGLKEAIRSAKQIEAKIVEGLSVSEAISGLGVAVLSVNVLAIKASPEMSRALETEMREKLQQEADEAIYERRNFALEQERKMKETELNTEIAVEEKKKQIDEKKMEAEVQRTENERRLREMKMQADIVVEGKRSELVEQKTANDRKEAEAQGYAVETLLKPYKELDWKTLTALNGNSDARLNIALAFRQLAENADKIGSLNISPDLLDSLLTKRK